MLKERKEFGISYLKFSFLILIIAVISFCFFISCDKKEEEEKQDANSYEIYYLNNEETKLVPEIYKARKVSSDELIWELLQAMENSPKDLSLRKVKSDDISIKKVEADEGQLTIDFNSNYKKMEAVKEILYRAAVVKTLSQIQGVEFIQFYVEGQPLTNQNEQLIGFMSAENFIDNTGKETNYYQNVSMVLYFANKGGTKLKETHVTKIYDGTVTMEQLVIQQLLAGTESIEDLGKGYYDTIPKGTSLIKTTTKEGIAYVDFSAEFLTKREGLSDEVAIYSIVNSLVELSSVNKVQFTINGLLVEKFGDGISFDGIFERNLDIVE